MMADLGLIHAHWSIVAPFLHTEWSDTPDSYKYLNIFSEPKRAAAFIYGVSISIRPNTEKVGFSI